MSQEYPKIDDGVDLPEPIIRWGSIARRILPGQSVLVKRYSHRVALMKELKRIDKISTSRSVVVNNERAWRVWCVGAKG
jgi:hypothetical protein